MIIARKQLKKKRKRSESFSNPTLTSVKILKRLRAKVRHVVKQQKKNSWGHVCSKLNSKTQTQHVWKAIRKIKGKGGSNSIYHLKVNGTLIPYKKKQKKQTKKQQPSSRSNSYKSV